MTSEKSLTCMLWTNTCKAKLGECSMQRQHTMILTTQGAMQSVRGQLASTRRKGRRHRAEMRKKLLERHLLSILEGVRGAY